MKYPRHLTQKQVAALELETISTELKVYLTRVLQDNLSSSDDSAIILQNKNRFINKSLNLQGQKIYVLEGDDWGAYHPAEYAWHNGEFELVFRRLNTPQFIEFLGDLIKEGFFSVKKVNSLLEREGASFRYNDETGKRLRVDVLSLQEMEQVIRETDIGSGPSPHENIRVLIGRAEDALKKSDAAGVLHPCASALETLAKDVIGDPNIDNESFGGFFSKYRKESNLPDQILDYIHEQYKQRNTTPTAGHGSRLTPPTMTEDQMVLLIEMTKAFIRTEYRLSVQGKIANVKKA